MMAPEEIRRLIRQALPDAEVELEDLTGGQDHWSAVVISEAFAGRPSVVRHRMVYGALGDAMGGPIHAFALETHTPAERAAS
jgi:stress-induced morphogen